MKKNGFFSRNRPNKFIFGSFANEADEEVKRKYLVLFVVIVIGLLFCLAFGTVSTIRRIQPLGAIILINVLIL